ncbi:sensor domain-containing diguanylate cyclase [Glaciecola petra]|uniref:Sensor domain-containing diguanylate cyclase n=1 Tax=Glaciecola petra TaxID=3075602 RepID=A0ABU2ZRP5_9ALTE|nr:sensor domain-containing diguanylate cyclase [Aestuariibacter sp. P117]MDT0595306.1 sensor domain-containing diguanylate cyclase [Aestuariibacter sp. P117]
MNKSGLLLRLAIVIGFSSLAIGFLSTQIFYQLTFNHEVKIAQQSITNLYKTIEATAGTAAYLAEKDLAQEVVDGLATNVVVLNAKMNFEGEEVTSNNEPFNEPRIFPISSLFEADKSIGLVTIAPNLSYIENRAKKLAMENSIAMIIQALVVTVVAIVVAFLLITQPIIKIAKALHNTIPGDGERLAFPYFHKKSELGELVQDVNVLLEKTDNQFKRERKLRQEIEGLEKRFRMLFENSVSPIILMEPRGDILLFNTAFEHTIDKLGLQLKKSYGPLLENIFCEPKALMNAVEESFAYDEIAIGEYRLLNEKSTEAFWVQVVVTNIVNEELREYHQITLHDISKRKKELETLAHQADFDKLTQLLNRQGLEKRIAHLLKEEQAFCLALIDLNWFKQVNDVYGHDSGDEILVFVADKIKKTLSPDDFGGRWGGDEFVLLLTDANVAEAKSLIIRLLTRISKPYFLRNFNENVTIGSSVGAAFYPDDGQDLQRIINLADKAMYDVKEVKNHNPEESVKFAGELTENNSIHD